MRVKTIKLGYGLTFYRVLVVKNTTELSPGDDLSRSQVNGLCHDPCWDVTIVTLKTEAA